MENEITYKQKRAQARRTTKESKQYSWQSFVSTINSHTPSSIVWKKINSMKNNTKLSTSYTQNADGSPLTDHKQIADHLANHFALNSSDQNYSEEFLNIKSQLKKNSNNRQRQNLNLDPINKPFRLDELTTALASCGDTSPGPDNTPNAFIKQLPEQALKFLLKLYNFIWHHQLFPEAWREATVIPIPKADKDITQAINHRLISLTCSMRKTLEKMVCKRLRWKMNDENWADSRQFGFWHHKSTTDYLVNLESYICDLFANNFHVLAVSLDLEKAFEMVSPEKVINILEVTGLNGNILSFKNFLHKRKIRVKFNNSVSDPVEIENGVPQGSVLGVLIFLIAINGIFAVIEAPLKALLFADDLTILCPGKNLNITTRLMQLVLDNLYKWTLSTGFKFSAKKSQFTIFTKK